MANDRLSLLQQFVATKPDQPFPLYGLAMEYKRLERFAEAKSVFAELITRHPSYVASYLMAGQVLIKLGERKAAYELYEQGITAAKQANDEHAKQELMVAQAELE